MRRVCKFGGTSVATRERWETILSVARSHLREGRQPLVVCSAVSGVTNRLEEVAERAPSGGHEEALAWIRERHGQLAAELEVDPAAAEGPLVQLERLATGISLTGECTPRLRAQLLAQGELISTLLGEAFMRSQGAEVRWWDARELLRAVEEDPSPRAYLSATCSHDPDPAARERLQAGKAEIHLTQGFIASNSRGETVLLGRGGSDTSAAYLAARLGAESLEIWTDVPGMYTADPRKVPEARLLRELDYEEAQELATMGAGVLHPRCLAPVRTAGIPLEIRCTLDPAMPGTRIWSGARRRGGQVRAVSSRSGVMLVSMETLGMWQQVGFLADAFGVFKRHGLSVDLVATSETNVTATLDAGANPLGREAMEALIRDLAPICQARPIGPCATVSLVGNRIRSILHRLGPALELFEEQRVHLVSQAASDLNLTFVVDEDQADKLLVKLHSLLFSVPEDEEIGPTWEEQLGRLHPEPAWEDVWWRRRREDLLALAEAETPVYVYDRASLEQAARALLGLACVDRVFYSMKANPNPEVLQVFHELGLGFECVSPGELQRLRELFPDLAGERVLYTPNFARAEDYQAGFEAGATVTLDNLGPLETWPDLFRGRQLFVRVDPGRGGGHHRHVRTAGPLSKFGVSEDQVDRLLELLRETRVTVLGLHCHAGSGIRDPRAWLRAALVLARVAKRFPEVRVLDLGGGLGVPEKPADPGLDLARLDRELAWFREGNPGFQLWLEPGRYLVAPAGVLLARVTQLKSKGRKRFVGIDAGMHTLIRPALYGAYHAIVNLSRLDDPSALVADVVGPICETGDVLGHDRRLPETRPGDVLLIANAGAYGAAMSSRYNLRGPAAERILEPR